MFLGLKINMLKGFKAWKLSTINQTCLLDNIYNIYETHQHILIFSRKGLWPTIYRVTARSINKVLHVVILFVLKFINFCKNDLWIYAAAETRKKTERIPILLIR